MGSIEDTIKECESGSSPHFKLSSSGERYCPLFTSLYKQLCPYLSKDSVFVCDKYGNYSIDRWYSRCNLVDGENDER